MQSSTSALPEGWSTPDLVQDVVVADGVELRRAGFSSTGPSGEELSGAAVEADCSPVDRGYFELLERVSTVEALRLRLASYDLLTTDGECVASRIAEEVFPESDAPTCWRFARSSGVAIHATWQAACGRAYWELAERDRVLRAWYGETRPERIDFAVESTPLRGSESYQWLAYSFPVAPEADFSSDVEVVGLFGIPARPDAPLISGYGARLTLGDALDAAAREAMQLLGFLWGESVIGHPPDLAPTPLHHLEHYQWPGHRQILRQWLELGHERFFAVTKPSATSGSQRAMPVTFVDLTPSWLGGGLRVAKAVCDAAAPLAFGQTPFVAHLPPELRTHPIG